jgi:hypothetical protein
MIPVIHSLVAPGTTRVTEVMEIWSVLTADGVLVEVTMKLVELGTEAAVLLTAADIVVEVLM